MKNIKNKSTRIISGSVAAAMTLGSAAATGVTVVSAENAVYFQAAGEDTSHIKPVDINESTFPDPVFRSLISSRDFDRDGDGTLSVDEIIHARNIKCEGKGVKSLKGIEYLVELRGLYCRDNQIENLGVENNKLITGIWCSGNDLKKLDFTANPNLEWVYCYDCNLTSLNVANNPKMSYIECNTNHLKTLDVSHNPLLEHLMCGSCELISLDVTHNPELQHLDAFRNEFKTLDLSHNPKMKRLNVWDNPGLGSVDVSNCPGLQYYNCAHNEVTDIDVSHNPELNKLVISYNHGFSEVDISHNPKLVYLDCASTDLTSLDLSHNPNLRFLQAFTTKFDTLDISHNPYLIKTYNEGVKKDESKVCKGHSWTIDYGGDTSTGNDHIFFLCFDDVVTLKTESDGEVPVISTPYDDDDKITDTENLVTREMLVQTLYEMAGKPDVRGLKSRFTDVEHGAWYEDALLWGEANSICIGYPDITFDTFGVGKWIMRQDVMLMLMRYSEYANLKRAIDFGRSDPFIDYFEVDFDHWEAVCWAATWNIMVGKGEPGAPKEERYIDPYGRATREEIDTMLERMMEKNGINKTVKVIATPESVKTSTTTTNATPVTSVSSSSVSTAPVSITTTTESSSAQKVYSLGDVNGDKMIDGRDATDVLTEYARTSVGAGAEFNNEQKKAADANEDNKVDARDATLVISYYTYASAGHGASFPDYIKRLSKY